MSLAAGMNERKWLCTEGELITVCSSKTLLWQWLGLLALTALTETCFNRVRRSIIWPSCIMGSSDFTVSLKGLRVLVDENISTLLSAVFLLPYTVLGDGDMEMN